jgi:hypothetical protein
MEERERCYSFILSRTPHETSFENQLKRCGSYIQLDVLLTAHSPGEIALRRFECHAGSLTQARLARMREIHAADDTQFRVLVLYGLRNSTIVSTIRCVRPARL